MTTAAVAFVPAAPLLVPQVAGGSAAVDDALRAEVLGVIARVLAVGPDVVTVVGPVAVAAEWSADATWDFAGFGVARRPPVDRPRLPWPLGVGAWLLDECGWAGARRYLGVAASTQGQSAIPDASTTVVIAVGDGSACRTEKAPGHFDDRAESFDNVIAEVLATGDANGFDRLDDELAADLLCAGLPVWQWVASAVAGAEVTKAELATHVAPYGVGYFAGIWLLG